MAESITDLLKRDIRNWMFKMVKKSFSTWWHLLVRAGGSHCQSRTFGKIWGLECDDDHGDHVHDGDDVEYGDEGDQFSLSWRMRGTVLVSSPHLCLCLSDHIDTIYVQVRKVLNSYVFMFRQANDHNHLLTNLTIWWLSSIARIKVVPDLGWPPMMVMMMMMTMVMSMDGTVDI